MQISNCVEIAYWIETSDKIIIDDLKLDLYFLDFNRTEIGWTFWDAFESMDDCFKLKFYGLKDCTWIVF